MLFCYFYHDEIDKVRAAVPGICSLWLSTPLILSLSQFPAEGESFPVRLCVERESGKEGLGEENLSALFVFKAVRANEE